MNRYFAIYHGLMPTAPWGVAVQRKSGGPKVELLLLCRTQKEAVQAASLTGLGHGLKTFRDKKVAERTARSAGAK